MTFEFDIRGQTGLVSVVMPVLNAERWLAEALASVRAQTYPHIELVMIDGGSTDATEAIARQFAPDQYLAQTEPGLWPAFNQGIVAARGEYISFLSSDDRWTPDKTARQVARLQAEPELDYIFTHVLFFLEPGCAVPDGIRPEAIGKAHAARYMESLMARRSLFARVGLIDTAYTIAADVDWFLRAAEAGARMDFVPEPLLFKRVHDGNLTYADSRATEAHVLRVLHAATRRARARSQA